MKILTKKHYLKYFYKKKITEENTKFGFSILFVWNPVQNFQNQIPE